MACGLQRAQVNYVVLKAIRKNTGITARASDSIWFKLKLGADARQYIVYWVQAELAQANPPCHLRIIDISGAQIVGDVQTLVFDELQK